MKKNKVFISFVLFALIFTSLLFFTRSPDLYANPGSILVCLDPGHGGNDPGAIGPTGLTEKEVNIDIALRVRAKLQAAGYRVIMTRESDTARSMQQRVDIANANGANIFVSIHNNAFVTPTPNGTETYYCTTSPSGSGYLATFIQSETVNQIKTANRGVKSADFFVLKNTRMISALVEGAFISNPTEEQRLRDPNFREGMATGIFNGIHRFATTQPIAPQPASPGNAQLADFVTRFYNLCMSRSPDPGGLSFWTNALLSKSKTGGDVASDFINSQEFANRNVSNEEFLNIMYKAFFNRQPDPGGFSGWLNDLHSGRTRQYVLAGFINSQEFRYLCANFGINPGSLNPGAVTLISHQTGVTSPTTPITADTAKISAFVTRFYQQCLFRSPDPSGLSHWVGLLSSGSKTGADIASEFVNSPEFVGKNLSNGDFVTVMYKSFFNRPPDTSGFNSWVNDLNSGRSRQYVLAGFVNSAEFKSLCATFGINPGTLNPNAVVSTLVAKATTQTATAETEQELQNPDEVLQTDTEKIKEFVIRFYETCLNRNPDQEGLDGWIDSLFRGQITGALIASNFILSEEMEAKELNDEEFLNILYITLFNREPDKEGMVSWLEEMAQGKSRRYILANFVNSEEFSKLCDLYKINTGFLLIE